MGDQYRSADAVSSHNYVVIDGDGVTIGEFTSLTGGQMEVNTIKYKATDSSGKTSTKHVPGSYSYSPIELSRALTPDCESMYLDWEDARAGKVNLQAMTIEIRPSGSDVPIVRWDLEDVLVSRISGFEFNKGYFSEFRVTLQPKRIRMGFPEVKNT